MRMTLAQGTGRKKGQTPARKKGQALALPQLPADETSYHTDGWLSWFQTLPGIITQLTALFAAVAAVLMAWRTIHTPIVPPSFSCEKRLNLNKVEKLICDDPALAVWDIKLDSWYNAAVAQMPLAVRQRLKQEEGSWRRRQRDACENRPAEMAACVDHAYSDRIKELQRLMEPTSASSQIPQSSSQELFRFPSASSELPYLALQGP
jgi:uncharacterized protein